MGTTLDYAYNVDTILTSYLNGDITRDEWERFSDCACLYVEWKADLSDGTHKESSFIVHLQDILDFYDGKLPEEISEQFVLETFRKMLNIENYVENYFL